MEYVSIVVIILFIVVIKFALNVKLKDIKKIKEIGFNKELNDITNKLPENTEICKGILKMIDNNTVNIKEEKNIKSSLYIVATNSIIIANIKDTFTRVQTIAHECLHSVQNKRTLMFNFIFSNIYLIYFVLITVLTIFKIVNNPLVHIFILIFISFIYYMVRSYLEIDAMTKAKYLAKEYIESKNILKQEEIDKILNGYTNLNELGIKFTCFMLAFNSMIKLLIYCIVAVVIY